MPTLELEFEVYCSCGNGLCGQTKEGTNRHSQYITVEPCQKCIDSAKEEGRQEGYETGYNEAKEELK